MFTIFYTANEGPVRIQYKCLVPIYVLPETKLRGLLISKQNYNVLSTNSTFKYCNCERFMYSQDQSSYYDAAK